MSLIRPAIIRVVKLVEDAYLRFMNPNLDIALNIDSHMTIKERITLSRLSRNATTVAEIGSYIGASACCFGAAASVHKNTQIICIDTWNNDAMSEGNRDTWVEFKNNVAGFSDFVKPIRGFSTDVVEQVRNITPCLDLLFIDGDHSYEGVKADWEAYKNFLKPGSIIVFHDVGWAEGVKRVVREDVLPLVSSCDQLPNMWWGTLFKQP